MDDRLAGTRHSWSFARYMVKNMTGRLIPSPFSMTASLIAPQTGCNAIDFICGSQICSNFVPQTEVNNPGYEQKLVAATNHSCTAGAFNEINVDDRVACLRQSLPLARYAVIRDRSSSLYGYLRFGTLLGSHRLAPLDCNTVDFTPPNQQLKSIHHYCCTAILSKVCVTSNADPWDQSFNPSTSRLSCEEKNRSLSRSPAERAAGDSGCRLRLP